MNHKIFLAAPLALAAACASHGPQSQLGTQEKASREIHLIRTNDCVFETTINDFDIPDDHHVVLFTSGRRRAYLAELSGGCFDLSARMTLATVDRDKNGQICGYGADSIAYQRGGTREDCRITGLEKLSDERREVLGVSRPPPPKPKKEKAPMEEKESGETK
jgi:Family of unknown function (DUF6491)